MCLIHCPLQDPTKRPTATQLLQHRFVTLPLGKDRSVVVEALEKCKKKGGVGLASAQDDDAEGTYDEVRISVTFFAVAVDYLFSFFFFWDNSTHFCLGRGFVCAFG